MYTTILDLFKIGVGPSSSHTLGPWMIVLRFLNELNEKNQLNKVSRVHIELQGSLAKTGKGHGSDVAVLLALRGEHPEHIDSSKISHYFEESKNNTTIQLLKLKNIPFNFETDIVLNKKFTSPVHPNSIACTALLENGEKVTENFYSVGGGYIKKEGEKSTEETSTSVPYNFSSGDELQKWCERENKSISSIILSNEASIHTEETAHKALLRRFEIMREGMYNGCIRDGELPGGLFVKRRARFSLHKLVGEQTFSSIDQWEECLRTIILNEQNTILLGCTLAYAISEENASLSRIVTAPTNGASGIIPASLMHYLITNPEVDKEQAILRFLAVAGSIGFLFNKNATISGAQGGCQAEVGVAASMAAAALTELKGGKPMHVLQAAEIAMEHHLGLTCDPIKGLVQIPCIERNTLGFIKALTASYTALHLGSEFYKVTLDQVIKTMKKTAKDMGSKYKETSEGGLAKYAIPVNVIDC